MGFKLRSKLRRALSVVGSREEDLGIYQGRQQRLVGREGLGAQDEERRQEGATHKGKW